MKAFIMSGGKGTRMQSVAADIPKPMIPVSGKPVLAWQVESLVRVGVKDITLIIGYLGDQIRSFFGDGSSFGARISYIEEDVPLGTGGALSQLSGYVYDDFVLVFGDLMLDIDWGRFMRFHKKHHATATLLCHPNSHPFDSDLVITDSYDRVMGFDSKHNIRDYDYHNYVNAGVYCMHPDILKYVGEPIKKDLEKDVLPLPVKEGRVYAYSTSEYVKDMGTPSRYEAVVRDVENGVVNSRSLLHKQRCVFLDRDGTVNVYKGFLRTAREMELISGVTEAIALLNKSSYLTIVATNQPVIARGETSFNELDRIHARMETLLGQKGAYVDAIYYCPHHPDSGFEGEVPELKISCDCRKPKTGMIAKAVERYNIDLSQSWYVGDTTVDVQTGINAGMKTILLMTGEAGSDGKYDVEPTFIAKDLMGAVERILSEHTFG